MKVIIAGGGTGGHVFPAIAIANALKSIDNSTEILFVGAKGKLEMEKVPSAGYKIIGLWISGFQRSLSIKNLTFPFKVIHSLLTSKKILANFKPDAVVGVGGYASGPMLKAAAQKGIPIIIQEQNSYAGITNKLLAKQASAICVAYEGMEKFFPKDKLYLTGNPVRLEVCKIEGKRTNALNHFQLSENKKTIIVLGGSLGALTLNEAMELHASFLENHPEIQVLWQCGKTHFERFKNAETAQLPNVRIMPFIEKMDYAYAVADLIIARAGALTISELCLIKKPVILVPSPNVAEDHQTKNATALTSKHAAIMVKDSDARKQLFNVAIDLLNNGKACREMGMMVGSMAKPDAAHNIAEVIRLKAI
jgi:UDP-N-acetylglucosamine--N-acetylmuramyl-(pentapeptide) pyrophosphoryl-undecaprenol N-acetylglucosamine transferase